eukprot:11199255-Lingulodinium_polyedra.AAC.1
MAWTWKSAKVWGRDVWATSWGSTGCGDHWPWGLGPGLVAGAQPWWQAGEQLRQLRAFGEWGAHFAA